MDIKREIKKFTDALINTIIIVSVFTVGEHVGLEIPMWVVVTASVIVAVNWITHD